MQHVVVPPKLLVKLFGVPSMVVLPSKVGQATTFSAHGQTFHVKRVSRESWLLTDPREAGYNPNGRWGNAEEISDDIGHVLECGRLPHGKGGGQ